MDNERISYQKLNNERINENMVCNEEETYNSQRNNKIIYEMKKKDETTVIAVKYCESGREEVIKNDKEKIKNDNNDNNSPKISHKRREKNVIGKNLHYQGIIMLLIIIIIDKAYISEFKNNLNYELNCLFIFIFYIIMNYYFSNETLIEQKLIYYIYIYLIKI